MLPSGVKTPAVLSVFRAGRKFQEDTEVACWLPPKPTDPSLSLRSPFGSPFGSLQTVSSASPAAGCGCVTKF